MWRADLLMAQGLLVNLLRKARETVLNLKDLLTETPSGRSETLSRFAGPARCGVADLLIKRGLLVNLLRKVRETLLNLKDFLAGFLPNSRAPFSCLVGRVKRREADLLTPQGLLAGLRRMADERSLNLKDLLTVFPPGSKRLFENEPVWRPLYQAKSRQIQPFSAKTCQNMAENRDSGGQF